MSVDLLGNSIYLNERAFLTVVSSIKVKCGDYAGNMQEHFENELKETTIQKIIK